MPYVSKREREIQREALQKEQERARWIHFMDAVTYVQEKEDCTVKNAAEQLIIAIVDGALAACWDDVLGLEAAAPSDFSGVVKICLYDIGFVERIKVPEELEIHSSSDARQLPNTRN